MRLNSLTSTENSQESGRATSLQRDFAPREGVWTLYSRKNLLKVFAIEAVFATTCMIFAAIWCVKNHGGIQDGSAIASTGIAYATIILGASQAVSQNHWR